MRKLHALLNEITMLTSNIESNYPELYRFLDENPDTISIANNNIEIDQNTLENHLESLKQILKHHITSHKKKVT